jgi:hypothetical protein
MNGFMERARKLYFTKRREFPRNELVECHCTLMAFQAECLASSWSFNRNWENIEELYTQADLLRLAGRRDAKELCDKIAWSIWDVYRGSFSNPSHLKTIAEKLAKWGLHPVFVTTNYDTLIESQLRTNFHYPGFAYIHRRSCYVEDDNPGHEPASIPIIKLHGSVNWFQTDDESNKWVGTDCMMTDGYTLAHHRANLDLADYKEVLRAWFAGEVTKVTGKGFAPAIIPPMLGKASVSRVITKQWGAAIEALSRARQIWIIGYSFPQTDTFMLRLLSAGIESNPNLQKIVIIDYELYSDWKARLEAMFSPMTLQHRVDFFSAESRSLIEYIAEAIDAKQDPSGWASAGKSHLSAGHINARLHEKRLKDPSIYAP